EECFRVIAFEKRLYKCEHTDSMGILRKSATNLNTKALYSLDAQLKGDCHDRMTNGGHDHAISDTIDCTPQFLLRGSLFRQGYHLNIAFGIMLQVSIAGPENIAPHEVLLSMIT